MATGQQAGLHTRKLDSELPRPEAPPDRNPGSNRPYHCGLLANGQFAFFLNWMGCDFIAFLDMAREGRRHRDALSTQGRGQEEGGLVLAT